MKKILTVVITLITLSSYAQITFEKGYFINNNDERIECFIKNIDWKNNPTKFSYREDLAGEMKENSILSVKEFGVDNFSKYERHTVDIDVSSSKLENLSQSRLPEFKKKTLFLKVLVDDNRKLYYYENNIFKRFFYSIENSDEVKQLIYKNYFLGYSELLRENLQYRQQLSNSFSCNLISEKEIKKVKYTTKHLIKIFNKENQCGNEAIEIKKINNRPKRDLFNLTPKIGLNIASFDAGIASSNKYDFKVKNKIGYKFGIELEIILPYKQNTWSIIFEPTYQKFSTNYDIPEVNEFDFDRKAELTYTSIELPISFRHYFFLKNKSSLFLSGFYITDPTFNKSTLKYSSGAEYDIPVAGTFGLGAGFKYRDRYLIDLKYYLPRSLSSSIAIQEKYSSITIFLGYTIF